MIRKLIDLLGLPTKREEEEELEQEVRRERQQLVQRKRRVDRVLREFHEADTVIRGAEQR